MTNGRFDKGLERDVAIAWFAWVVSLFLSAAGVRADGSFFKRGTLYLGWQAAEVCLLSPSEVAGGPAQHLFRLMGLTNFIVLMSPSAVMSRRLAIKRTFMYLAIGAVFLNLAAFFIFGPFLLEGYWVWLASFILLAWALWRDRLPHSP